MAALRYWPIWRAVPSAVLSAILPAKPSTTTTSTTPWPIWSPSTKPRYSSGRPVAAFNQAWACLTSSAPLISSTPTLSRPTVGRSMWNRARAMAAPISAKSQSWRALAPMLAPTSRTMHSAFTVGHRAAMAGRSIAGIGPQHRAWPWPSARRCCRPRRRRRPRRFCTASEREPHAGALAAAHGLARLVVHADRQRRCGRRGSEPRVRDGQQGRPGCAPRRHRTRS